MTTNFNLPTDVATLQAMLVAAYTDVAYNCLTKAGIMALHTYTEGMSVIFLDVNDMHSMNSVYGYAGVDARIKAAIAVRSSDVVAARWMSGDEIIFIVPSDDAVGLVARLEEGFALNGLSSMYGIAALTTDLNASVLVAATQVQEQKAARDAA